MRLADGSLLLCTRVGGAAFTCVASRVTELPSSEHQVKTEDGTPLEVEALGLASDGTAYFVANKGSLWSQSSPTSPTATLLFAPKEPEEPKDLKGRLLRSRSTALSISGIEASLATAGFGSPNSRASVAAESARDPFVSIACGSSHCLAMTQAGKVFAWGIGSSGQLGLGDDSDRTTPTPLKIGAQRAAIVAVAAGHAHSAATDARGQLYTWGDGGDGRLGLEEAPPRRRCAPSTLPVPFS